MDKETAHTSFLIRCNILQKLSFDEICSNSSSDNNLLGLTAAVEEFLRSI